MGQTRIAKATSFQTCVESVVKLKARSSDTSPYGRNIRAPTQRKSEPALVSGRCDPIVLQDDGTYEVTQPIESRNLLTPEQKLLESIDEFRSRSPSNDEVETCALNLLCYRSGSKGCVKRRIEVVARFRFATGAMLVSLLTRKPELITTKKRLFLALRHEYHMGMCGFWREYCSLRTLRQLRVLSVRLPNLRHRPDSVTNKSVH